MRGMRNGNRFIRWNFKYFHEMCARVYNVIVCHQSDYSHPKKKTMRIYKFHMSMYVHIRKYLRFSVDNILFRQKFQRQTIANEYVCLCGERRMQLKGTRVMVYSNPIGCKWPFEMFVKGVSNCIYSPIIMRPLWFRAQWHSILTGRFISMILASERSTLECRRTDLFRHTHNIYTSNVEMQLEVFFNPNNFWILLFSIANELSQWDLALNVEVHVEWHNSTEI